MTTKTKLINLHFKLPSDIVAIIKTIKQDEGAAIGRHEITYSELMIALIKKNYPEFFTASK